MPTKVNIPNVGIVNFPDSMTLPEIEAKAREIHQNSLATIAHNQGMTSPGDGQK
jgi:hypothetical protein